MLDIELLQKEKHLLLYIKKRVSEKKIEDIIKKWESYNVEN